MNIEELKKEVTEEEEEEEITSSTSIPPMSEEDKKAVRKRLFYFRTIYYILGFDFMIAGIYFLVKKELIAGFIFFAISSIVSVFGKICESAMKDL